MENKLSYRNFTVSLYHCDDVEGPDGWGNQDVFLVYDHKNFCVKREGFDPERIFRYLHQNAVNSDSQRVDEHEKDDAFDGYAIFPVYAYIHSGVSLSLGKTKYPFTCPFDTSMRGYMLVSKMDEDSLREYQSYDRYKGKSEDEIMRMIAEMEISEWNTYLSGDVWDITITDEKGDEVDSLCNIYGYDYAVQEAHDIINEIMARRFREWELKLRRKEVNDIGFNVAFFALATIILMTFGYISYSRGGWIAGGILTALSFAMGYVTWIMYRAFRCEKKNLRKKEEEEM